MTTKPEMWNDFAVQADDLNAMPHENTYAGVTSFLRRPYRKDLTQAEVAVVGVPFDTATTTSRQCVKAKIGNSMPSSSQIGVCISRSFHQETGIRLMPFTKSLRRRSGGPASSIRGRRSTT